jgi:hypothetical protein
MISKTQSFFFTVCAGLGLAILTAGCDREPPDRTGVTPEGVYTIEQLQDYRDPGHPASETSVQIRKVVVTAIDEYDEDGQGRIGSIWVGDVDGSGAAVCGWWCGITTFNPSVVPRGEVLKVGDLVDVSGIYSEFLYNDDGRLPNPDAPLQYHAEHLSEINSATVFKTGEWVPVAPVDVDAMEVQMEPEVLQTMESAEALEGVLVTVRDLTASSGYDSYGQFETREWVMVEDDLYRYPCRGYEDDITGTHFDSITGVITWFGINNLFGQYKILPRGPEDISPRPDFPECAD